MLTVEGLAKSYGGPPVFTDVSFSIGRGERMLILGLNGAGKTTLLRILTDQTEADAGTFEYGYGVEPGYYAQEHEGIVDGVDVLRHMKQASAADDVTLRSLMGMFGLHGDIAFQDAGTLSGGEKTKLALAQLVAGRKNLLLLDEPTNNLDPISRTAIAEGLRGWPGAMVIVSHDPEFVDSACPGAGLVDAGRPARLLRRRSSRLGGARLSRLDFAAHFERGVTCELDRRPGVRQRRCVHGRCGPIVGARGRRAMTAPSSRSAPTTRSAT